MSTRLKLAAEAESLSRSIFASLPFNVRAAASISEVIKLAFGTESYTLGLAALQAMAEAGVTGTLFKTVDMDEVREYLSRNQASPLTNIINKLGNVLFKELKKTLNPQAQEEAFNRVVDQLISGRSGLNAVDVSSAMSYLKTLVARKGKDVSQLKDFKTRVNPGKLDVSQLSGSLLRSLPTRVWKETLRRLGNDPDFLDAEGKPRMKIILDGLMAGKPMATIARDELKVDPKTLAEWFKAPARQRKLRKVLEPLQDYFEMLRR